MKLLSVAGLGIVLAVAAGCHGKEAPPPPPPPPAVVVTPVVQRDVPVFQEWIGTTQGNVNAEIRPQVDGYLLRRVYAEGSFVQQGDLMFEIDARQVARPSSSRRRRIWRRPRPSRPRRSRTSTASDPSPRRRRSASRSSTTRSRPPPPPRRWWTPSRRSCTRPASTSAGAAGHRADQPASPAPRRRRWATWSAPRPSSPWSRSAIRSASSIRSASRSTWGFRSGSGRTPRRPAGTTWR